MQIEDITPFYALTLTLVVWVVWKISSRFLGRSPLDNIPGPKFNSILTGNLGQMFNRHGWGFQYELGEKYGPVVKLNGILGQRFLYVFDPKAMHNIIVKDQYVFQPAKWFTESNQAGFGPGLLSVYGETHRRQRKMLNPVFSINHMRHMTPIFYAIAHKLRDAIGVQVKESPKDLDMLRWIGRTALELVGQGGLGYSFDPLIEDKPNAFGDAMKNLLPTVFQLQLIRFTFNYFTRLGSASFRRRLVELMPHPLIQKIKDIIDTMHFHAVDILNSKKQALKSGDEAVSDQLSQGKDIISVLLKVNMEASIEDRLPEEEVLAQLATLVFAATDTTTSALSQILLLLAEHPDVQDKLRREILEVRQEQDDITYDVLVDRLPYMDAVCRETLRLYPPVSFVFREAFEDAVLPLSKPIIGVNGQSISELSVPKGTFVAVGLLASNRNKEIWGEDAHEWKPERWMSPLPEAVTGAKIPGVYSNL
ncbi:cytochrome P450 [Abortiporus biennis]|nr:cytochrome P450 [Abortiporus biennis]